MIPMTRRGFDHGAAKNFEVIKVPCDIILFCMTLIKIPRGCNQGSNSSRRLENIILMRYHYFYLRYVRYHHPQLTTSSDTTSMMYRNHEKIYYGRIPKKWSYDCPIITYTCKLKIMERMSPSCEGAAGR